MKNISLKAKGALLFALLASASQGAAMGAFLGNLGKAVAKPGWLLEAEKEVAQKGASFVAGEARMAESLVRNQGGTFEQIARAGKVAGDAARKIFDQNLGKQIIAKTVANAPKDSFKRSIQTFAANNPTFTAIAGLTASPLYIGGRATALFYAIDKAIDQARNNVQNSSQNTALHGWMKSVKRHFPSLNEALGVGSLMAAGAGAYVYNEYSKNTAKFAQDAKGTYESIVKDGGLAKLDAAGLDALQKSVALYKSAYSEEQIKEIEALVAARSLELTVQAEAEAEKVPNELVQASGRLDRISESLNNLTNAALMLAEIVMERNR